MRYWKPFSLFVFFFALAYERIFFKTHSTRSRCVTGSENILFLSGVRSEILQAGSAKGLIQSRFYQRRVKPVCFQRRVKRRAKQATSQTSVLPATIKPPCYPRRVKHVYYKRRAQHVCYQRQVTRCYKRRVKPRCYQRRVTPRCYERRVKHQCYHVATLSLPLASSLKCYCFSWKRTKSSESEVFWSAEELETVPVDTKPRTPHHWSPGGERRGQRKHWMIFLERTREGHRRSDEHWNRSKDDVGGTSERRRGAHMGFSERIDTLLNWTELNSSESSDTLLVFA